MASSSSKPTGVHYALVVFVLISIVCGLGWLLAYKGANSISELERQSRGRKEEGRGPDEARRRSARRPQEASRIC